jgi:transcriptional regulator with XRE-family HTH domain
MIFNIDRLRRRYAKTYQAQTGCKLTMTRLAEELGTRRATLYELEGGRSTLVNIELLDRMCNFFGVQIDEIMTATVVTMPGGSNMQDATNAVQENELEMQMAELNAEFEAWAKANGFDPNDDAQRAEAVAEFLRQRNSIA